ncbi:MAG: shikimate kinase [Vicingus serpentipes]|nr:shikimate kinase [Vicingus serpentipes]
MKKTTKIFLIGFMGSGKSTLGKKIASQLNIGFLDLDYFIEEQENQTIQEIFDKHGEVYFREKEREVLKTVAEKKEELVVALGGGTPCFYDNMEIINRSGVSVYLKYNSGILTDRLMNVKTERPLIKNKSKEELLSFINDMLLSREKFYNQSQFILEGKNIKAEDIIDLLQ